MQKLYRSVCFVAKEYKTSNNQLSKWRSFFAKLVQTQEGCN